MAQIYPESSKYGLPPFWVPKEQKVGVPKTIPSNIWLTNIDRPGRIEKLRIQCVPLEVRVDNVANWAVIPVIGRNNPFYHYTGGEDVLKFTLDWYSQESTREDVIRKCRWVESLTRSNGYYDAPPRVVLTYGRLFTKTAWIITAAPYRLSLFDKEFGMLPRQAYQDITLKKVIDHNTTTDEIRKSSEYLSSYHSPYTVNKPTL